MVELQEIFYIEYGNSLDLNKITKVENSVNFVSRTAKNNGVSASVEELAGVDKMPAGTISVSLGGSVLEAFVQPKPYYTGYHIFCLSPKEGIILSDAQKLFYCLSIRANKYRYNYGRQANRTLRTLKVPSIDEIPIWINDFDISQFDKAPKPAINKNIDLPTISDQDILENIFTVHNGIATTKLNVVNERFKGCVAFVRPASTHKRTLAGYITRDSVNPKHIYPAGSLFISTNGEGSHTYSYVSTVEFVPNSDVAVLIPKREMSVEEKLYYATIITANRYRFSYGRKPKGKRMKNIILPKITTKSETGNIISFVQSLPFSGLV